MKVGHWNSCKSPTKPLLYFVGVLFCAFCINKGHSWDTDTFCPSSAFKPLEGAPTLLYERKTCFWLVFLLAVGQGDAHLWPHAVASRPWCILDDFFSLFPSGLARKWASTRIGNTEALYCDSWLLVFLAVISLAVAGGVWDNSPVPALELITGCAFASCVSGGEIHLRVNGSKLSSFKAELLFSGGM